MQKKEKKQQKKEKICLTNCFLFWYKKM